MFSQYLSCDVCMKGAFEKGMNSAKKRISKNMKRKKIEKN